MSKTIVTDAVNKLFKEHYEHYVSFTKLLLTISIGFITFIGAANANTISSFSALQKSAVVCHLFSIIFGVWLQYLIVKAPLDDIKGYLQAVQNALNNPSQNVEMFSRKPSKTQRFVFVAQVFLFIIAFVFTSVNIII